MNNRIISDPQICGGEAVIKGTRIPVHIILSHLAAGDDVETIVNKFPQTHQGRYSSLPGICLLFSN